MSEIQCLERIVNVVVGKPVTWAVYLLWHAAKAGYRCAVQLGQWLRERYARPAEKA